MKYKFKQKKGKKKNTNKHIKQVVQVVVAYCFHTIKRVKIVKPIFIYLKV